MRRCLHVVCLSKDLDFVIFCFSIPASLQQTVSPSFTLTSFIYTNSSKETRATVARSGDELYWNIVGPGNNPRNRFPDYNPLGRFQSKRAYDVYTTLHKRRRNAVISTSMQRHDLYTAICINTMCPLGRYNMFTISKQNRCRRA